MKAITYNHKVANHPVSFIKKIGYYLYQLENFFLFVPTKIENLSPVPHGA